VIHPKRALRATPNPTFSLQIAVTPLIAALLFIPGLIAQASPSEPTVASTNGQPLTAWAQSAQSPTPQTERTAPPTPSGHSTLPRTSTITLTEPTLTPPPSAIACVEPPAPNPEAIGVATAEELQHAVDDASATQPTTIRLLNDITLPPDTSLVVPADKVITIEGTSALIGSDYENTITLDGALTINGVTITHPLDHWASGAGIWARPLSHLTIAAGSISGNHSTGINLLGATLDIAGGEIADNSSSWSSGGVYAHGGDLSEYGTVIDGPDAHVTIRGCARVHDNFTNSSAYGSPWGHGLSIGAGDLTMTGGLIYHNGRYYDDQMTGAADGGGLAITDGANVEISGGVIGAPDPVNDPDQGNIAARGGGIYLASGHLHITGDARINGNSALGNDREDNTWTHEYRISGGGGIYVDESPADAPERTTLVIDSGVIAGNSADKGGGIMVDGLVTTGMTDETPPPKTATVDLRGGTIEANHAIQGSGVWAGADARLFIGGDTRIHHNGPDAWQSDRAARSGSTTQGGGVRATGAEFLMTGGQVTDNNAEDGGGIYLSSWADPTNTTPAPGSDGTGFAALRLTMNGGAINRNTALRGGGIHLDDAQFTMSGGVIGDPALGVDAPGADNQGNTAGRGGGIYLADEPDMPGITGADLIGTARVAGNRTVVNDDLGPYDGAGLWLGEHTRVDLAGQATVVGNTSVGNGGGVHLNPGNAELDMNEQSAIRGNTAINGGGIDMDDDTVVFLGDDSVIADNTATNGGGIHIAPATPDPDVAVLFADGRAAIERNRADRDGGGVHAGGNIEMEFSGDSRVARNQAGGSGGGIHIGKGGEIELSRYSHIDGNRAESAGGGIHAVEANVRLFWDEPIVSGNHSGSDGGGLHMTGGKLSGWPSLILENNTADRDGGGVYLSSPGHDSDDCLTASLTGNTAGRDGGGAYLTNAAVCVSDTVSGNTAKRDGGAIFLGTADLGSLKVSEEAEFSANSARDSFDRAPEYDAVYAENIETDKWTEPFTQGYNNYDIGYPIPRHHTVTFVDWDGTELSSQTVLDDDSAIAPPDPTRKDYAFSGWNAAFDHVEMDSTITATYRPLEWSIRYNYSGGIAPTVANPEQFNVEDLPLALIHQPVRTAYAFVGWVPEDSLSRTPIDTIPVGTRRDLILTALWAPMTITPAPMPSVTLLPPTGITPAPMPHVTPVSPGSVTPAPIPTLTPGIPSSVTPAPLPQITPTLPSSVTPAPLPTITPVLPTTVTPHPALSATPVWPTHLAPAPGGVVNPITTATPTPSVSLSPSPEATETPSPNPTPTTSEPPVSPSPSATVTPTATPSATVTPSVTATPTLTPSVTPTPTVVLSPGVTAPVTPSPIPTRTPQPSCSVTPTVTPSATVTPTASQNPTTTNPPAPGQLDPTAPMEDTPDPITSDPVTPSPTPATSTPTVTADPTTPGPITSPSNPAGSTVRPVADTGGTPTPTGQASTVMILALVALTVGVVGLITTPNRTARPIR
jgi:uncharacterized repeat protein (TIGR02543 family)